MQALSTRGLSSAVTPIFLSVVILVGAIVWQVSGIFKTPEKNLQAYTAGPGTESASTSNVFVAITPDASGQSASSSNSFSELGNTVAESLADAYSELIRSDTVATNTLQEKGAALAKTIAADIPSRVYSAEDVRITVDTSKERALAYRTDLQTSLQPLLGLSGPEFETFAKYTQSKDPEYLKILQADAQKYRDAIANTVAVTVPSDAREIHANILNAMGQFAAVLDALATHAQDPFASGLLLKNYNQGEADIVTTFQKLAEYFRAKVK